MSGATMICSELANFLTLQKESLDLAVKSLQVNYFASYGYTFPLTGNYYINSDASTCDSRERQDNYVIRERLSLN